MSDIRKTIPGGATWQEVAADRRRHRDATVEKCRRQQRDATVDKCMPEDTDVSASNGTLLTSHMQLLNLEELTMTNYNVEDITRGHPNAESITSAFLRRAALAQGVVNCITELLPDQAMRRAKELDAYWLEHKKPIGPLHGVPISVKEHIAMKGLDQNAGFVSWVGRVAEEDALLLQILWDAGAVFHARTAQPQSLMHLETSSNLYGVTANPFNPSLTAGGSSGGEGALVGLRGSVLGIGTDIGGSIRSPAANNGVFGFKPTVGRLPILGWSAPMAGCEAILGTIGPLSTSLEGVKLFMKTVVDAKPWLRSPSLVALDWKDISGLFSEKRLKVAVMWDDEVVKPHPPITRALDNIVMKLHKSQNVDVVDWAPQGHDRAWSIIAGLYFADGGAQTSEAINASGEPWMPLSEWIIKDNPHVKKHDVDSLWSACAERDEYRQKYAELWNTMADVDVILCPAGPGVAPKLNAARYWGYTSQWNLLDYPAVVFPAKDHVSVDKDGADVADYTPRNDADEYNWSQWKEHGAEGYKGGPISLQLVGRRYDDEKVLAALEVILEETGLPTTVPPTIEITPQPLGLPEFQSFSSMA
ncbi:hypothetical protein PG996_010700 [Apiospora saccharicola]|uniref:amidase n=1 Tax=Apiospora saccharicola TaxID=335842 RepID=A0ABR1URU4_9PEZI